MSRTQQRGGGRTVAPAEPLEVELGTLRRLGRHCFYVESAPEGAANAGIVVGSERVLLVDCRLTPRLGAGLARCARALAPRAAGGLLAVNTHYHGDHCFGNAAAGATAVIASRWTAEAARERWDSQVEQFIELRPHQEDEFRSAAKAPPQIGLDGPAAVELGGVTAEIRPLGAAHTPGDVAVEVAADGVAYVGDVVFNGHWPMLWDADLRGWLAALAELERRDLDWLVPGHGPAGDTAIARAMRECLELLAGMEARGGGVDDEAVERSPFSAWLHRDRVEPAVRAIAQQRGRPEAGR